MNKETQLGGVGQVAQGRFRWMVLDSASGEIVRQSDWINNLILNNGMDEVANRDWARCFTNASVGTGDLPTYRTNGTITATQAGSIVTLSTTDTYFSAGDVANMLKWTGGNSDERRITAALNGTQVTVTPVTTNANGGAASTFHTFHTNQTGLSIETKRSSTYLTGSPNCGSFRDGNLFRSRRTFDFTAEASPITYREVGVAWASSGANTHFARLVLPAPVALVTAQQVRVVYELNLWMNPATPVRNTGGISGWPVAPAVTQNGTECLQYVGMCAINSSNGFAQSTVGFDLGATINEPSDPASNSNGWWVSSLSTAPTAFAATPTDRTAFLITQAAAHTNVSYTPLNFFRDKLCTFTVNDANSSVIRSFGQGSDPSFNGREPRNYSYLFVWDENQTKDNEHTLTIRMRYTWSRILST